MLRTVLLLALVGFAPRAGAQDLPPEPDRAAILAAARSMIEKAPFAALITVGADGHPQARVVDPFEPEADLTVWIGTNPATRKVAQIAGDPRVTVFYMDPAGSGYVTLFGTAEIVSESAAKQAHWKEEWAAFYRDGHRGDDYVLIRVRPHRLEVLSYEAGLNGDPDTWQPAGIDL